MKIHTHLQLLEENDCPINRKLKTYDRNIDLKSLFLLSINFPYLTYLTSQRLYLFWPFSSFMKSC